MALKILQAFASVFASFVGIRSAQDSQKDLKRFTLTQLIIAGLGCALLLIVCLVVIVNLITHGE